MGFYGDDFIDEDAIVDLGNGLGVDEENGEFVFLYPFDDEDDD